MLGSSLQTAETRFSRWNLLRFQLIWRLLGPLVALHCRVKPWVTRLPWKTLPPPVIQARSGAGGAATVDFSGRETPMIISPARTKSPAIR